MYARKRAALASTYPPSEKRIKLKGDEHMGWFLHEFASASPYAAKLRYSSKYRIPSVESVSDEETSEEEISDEKVNSTAPSNQHRELTNYVLEVFLTFVWISDSRMNERRAIYVRQQQPLRDVLGPQVFGRFSINAMAFVYKAQQIRDVGQTAAEVSTLPTHPPLADESADHVPGIAWSRRQV